MTHRFPSLAFLLLAASTVSAAGPVIDPGTAKPDEKADVLWYDIRPLGLEGQAWADTKAPFDRLPAKAEKMVRPPVWGLSRDSAGLCVRFAAETPSIQARWTVLKKNLAMPHMPATGVSGLDLYGKLPDGRWQWVANGRPTAESNSQVLAGALPAGEREYLLYLPLYNGVSSVEIGLPKAVKLKKADAYPAGRAKPVVFYGTSITQGGCASRPGMVHTAIIGRKLNVPVVNLGFSGNGRLEKEVGELLAEIDAAVYVLDCLPNLNAQGVAERTEPFVKALRAARPNIPILMVEDRTYTNAPLNPGALKTNTDNRAAFKKAYESLTADGVKGLTYLEGGKLLGDDGEGTVDGSHPTDLGFLRQADVMIAALEPLLKSPSAKRR